MAAVIVIDRGLRTRSTALKGVAIAAFAALALITVVNVPVYLHRDTLAHWDRQVAAAQATCAAHDHEGLVTLVYGPFTSYPAWPMHLTCRQAFG
jgi:hypothetical protein